MSGCWESGKCVFLKLLRSRGMVQKLNKNQLYRQIRSYAFLVRNPEFANNYHCSARMCTSAEICESTDLLSMKPHEFAEFLRSKSIPRCFVVWDDQKERATASHSELQELADWMNDCKPYNRHEGVFMQLGMRTGCLMGAFVWKTNRGQACGGIRLTEYPTLQSYLQNGLRLSVRMGVKAALSGLWVGGGKGLIPEPQNKQHIHPEFRQKLFYDYGDFVSSLNGCYITATDVGVTSHDLYNVHSRTRWAICIPEDIGGSGSPAKLLGKGVICAMEAALDHLKVGSLSRKSVAVQGAGGVGLDVVSRLLSCGAEVYVTDASQKRVHDMKDTLAPKAKGRLTVEKVPFGDLSILEYSCDILSPCAIGHILTPATIPKIKAKIICGTANAQLASEEDCHLLNEMGLTYVFEFLPNRMAMVNSVHENYGRIYMDPEIEKHFDKTSEHSIYVLTKKLLQEASEKNITVMEAANQLAEEYSHQQHPLWPGRGKRIIQSLIDGEWHLGKDFWRKRRNFAIAEGCS